MKPVNSSSTVTPLQPPKRNQMYGNKKMGQSTTKRGMMDDKTKVMKGNKKAPKLESQKMSKGMVKSQGSEKTRRGNYHGQTDNDNAKMSESHPSKKNVTQTKMSRKSRPGQNLMPESGASRNMGNKKFG